MIYAKGELVKVVCVNDKSLEKFVGHVGKVVTSSKLQGETPFVVLFFLEGKAIRANFSHLELRLLSGVEDIRERSNFLSASRAYNR